MAGTPSSGAGAGSDAGGSMVSASREPLFDGAMAIARRQSRDDLLLEAVGELRALARCAEPPPGHISPAFGQVQLVLVNCLLLQGQCAEAVAGARAAMPHLEPGGPEDGLLLHQLGCKDALAEALDGIGEAAEALRVLRGAEATAERHSGLAQGPGFLGQDW